MFRLTDTEENGQAVFIIEGRFAGPAVAAIREFLRQQDSEGRGNPVLVDLMGVTMIDAAAKELLAEFHARGAKFRAKGCLNRAIVDQITKDATAGEPVGGSPRIETSGS
jgi:anti-anti-sigma regulatory factor